MVVAGGTPLDFKTPYKVWFWALALVWPENETVWRAQSYEGLVLSWHGKGLPARFELIDRL